MKQKRIGHGVLTIVLALAIIVGLLPVAAAAEGELGTIASFVVPQTEITIEAGTEIDSIGLPETLAATMEDGESKDIPVTWDDGGLYDKDTAGEYSFRAVIPTEYTYAGARPIATVTVEASDDSPKKQTEPQPEAAPQPEVQLGEQPPENDILPLSNSGLAVSLEWSDDGTCSGTIAGDVLTLPNTDVAYAKAVLTAAGNFDNAPAGSVNIRIPSYLIKSYSGYRGTYSMPVGIPQAPNTNASTSFNYTYDSVNEEIVISNHSVLNGAVSLSAEVLYVLDDNITRYPQAPSKEFQAQLSDGATTIQSNSLTASVPISYNLVGVWDGDSDGYGQGNNTLNNTLTTGIADFYISGVFNNAAADSVELRLPGYLFKNNDNSPAGTVSVDLPNVSTPNTEKLFYYTIDSATKEVVIKNSVALNGYVGKTIPVTYRYNYDDANIAAGSSGTITGVMKVNGTQVAQSTLYANLFTESGDKAGYIGLSKVGSLQYKWDTNWGTEPANASAYAYAVWHVHPYITYADDTSMQISYTDTLGSPINHSFVAWRYYDKTTSAWVWSHGTIDEIASKTFTWTPADSAAGYDDITIVSKMPKESLGSSATIRNTMSATAEGTPSTVISNATTTGIISYTNTEYEGDDIRASRGEKKVVKENDYYEMTQLINGHNVSAVWEVNNSARGFDLTKENGVYGSKEWTLSSGDGDMRLAYYGAGSALTNYAELTSGDYTKDSFYLLLMSSYGYAYNEDTGEYREGNLRPGEVVGAVYATNWSGTETKYGDIQYLTTASGVSQNGLYYVNGATRTFAGSSANPVSLPDNTKAVRFTMTDEAYTQWLLFRVTTTLHANNHVKGLVNSFIAANPDKNLLVQNDRTYAVTQGNTTICADTVASNSWFLSTLGETSEFSKTMSNGVPNTANGYDEHTVMLKSIDSIYVPQGMTAAECEGLLHVCHEGTFYDLLPSGMSLDLASIRLMDWTGAENSDYRYTVSVENYYKDTGRTLVKITAYDTSGDGYVVKNQYASTYLGSGFQVSYKLCNTQINIGRNGNGGYNLAAYSSDDSAPMTDNKYADTWGKRGIEIDLDGDNTVDNADSTNFRFMEDYWSTATLTAVQAGMTKEAYDERTGGYSSAGQISYGADYSYNLYYQNNTTMQSKNIVLYDVLENAYGTKDHWKGTYVGVDTSEAERLGINPTVYYSTTAGLDPKNNTSQRNLANTAIWSTNIPTNKASITAIAIDCSKKTGGSDFVLPESGFFNVIVNMKAPGFSAAITEAAKAYNKGMVSAKTAVSGGAWTDFVQECNEATEEFVAYTGEIAKTSNPASGTEAVPATVAEGSALTYTVAVSNTSNLLDWTSFAAEDALQDPLTIANVNTAGIRFYYSDAPSVIKTPGAGTGLTVASSGNTLLFTGGALKAGQTMYITIPVTLPTGVTTTTTYKDINNSAKLTGINGVAQDKQSNTTYHRIPATDIVDQTIVIRKAVTGDSKVAERQYEGYGTQQYNFEVVLRDENNNIVTANRNADVMYFMASNKMYKYSPYSFNVSPSAEHTGGRKHYLTNGAYIQFTIPGNWKAEIYETYADAGLESVVYKDTATGVPLAASNAQKSVTVSVDNKPHDITMTNNFKRELESAGLTISKDVAGASGSRDKEFTFMFSQASDTYTGALNGTYSYTGLGGKESGTLTFTDGQSETFTLKHGQSMIFADNSFGLNTTSMYLYEYTTADEYVLTSQADTGFTDKLTGMAARWPGTTVTNSQYITIMRTNMGGTVALTDTRDVTPATKLKISKAVTGEGAPVDDEFTFTVKVNNTLYGGKAYKVYKTNGDVWQKNGTTAADGKITLKGGEYALFEGIALYSTYSVSEEDKENYEPTPAGGLITGTITKEETYSAAFSNAYTVPPAKLNFSLSKRLRLITDGANVPDTTFTFTLYKRDGNTETPVAVSSIGSAALNVVTDANVNIGTFTRVTDWKVANADGTPSAASWSSSTYAWELGATYVVRETNNTYFALEGVKEQMGGLELDGTRDANNKLVGAEFTINANNSAMHINFQNMQKTATLDFSLSKRLRMLEPPGSANGKPTTDLVFTLYKVVGSSEVPVAVLKASTNNNIMNVVVDTTDMNVGSFGLLWRYDWKVANADGTPSTTWWDSDTYQWGVGDTYVLREADNEYFHLEGIRGQTGDLDFDVVRDANNKMNGVKFTVNSASSALHLNLQNVQDGADLYISKVVHGAGIGGDTTKYFWFTLNIKDADNNNIAKGTSFKALYGGPDAPADTTISVGDDGNVRFKLKSGQMLYLRAMDTSYKFTLDEDDYAAEGYTAKYSINNVVTASRGVPQFSLTRALLISFINDFSYVNAGVTIGKTVTGDYGDRTKDFTFQVTVKDGGNNDITTGLKYTGSKEGTFGVEHTVTLKHGQSITIADVPTNGTVRVIEYSKTGYATSYKIGSDGTDTTGIDTGAQNNTTSGLSIAFTNDCTITPTGVSLGGGSTLLIWSVVILLALVAIVFFVAKNKSANRRYRRARH